jgi:hypothetical protein
VTPGPFTPIASGTRLGPYEILASIGAGGMGEVSKARDTRFDRIVAVKIAQENFSDRFEREARAIAGVVVAQVNAAVGDADRPTHAAVLLNFSDELRRRTAAK